MSRIEVEEVVATLMKQVNSIADGYQYTICGSYRYVVTVMMIVCPKLRTDTCMRTLTFLSVVGETAQPWVMSTSLSHMKMSNVLLAFSLNYWIYYETKVFVFFVLANSTIELSLYVLICNVLIYILLYDRSSDAHSKC